MGQSLITITAKWVSSCCVAQDCMLDHVLRLTHTFVMRRSGEQVSPVSNAHGDDQLIPVGFLNPRLAYVRVAYTHESLHGSVRA